MSEQRLAFPPLCPAPPLEDGDGFRIDGIDDEQHQWVEGEPYQASNPIDGQPARWEPLICSRCGYWSLAWQRLQPPAPEEGGGATDDR